MTVSLDFDILLLGPTGYTGRFCAEHIVQNMPTNLKWAVAGRSFKKVEGVAKELKELNPDREDPGTCSEELWVVYLVVSGFANESVCGVVAVIEVQLTREELDPLVRRTKLVINAVGPYHLYSTPVVEACALAGTHYIDV